MKIFRNCFTEEKINNLLSFQFDLCFTVLSLLQGILLKGNKGTYYRRDLLPRIVYVTLIFPGKRIGMWSIGQ